jgi:hypothetical protein
MAVAEVQVHTENPIHYLLVGRLPTISPAKAPRTRPLPKLGSVAGIDMSGFPPPITAYRQARPVTQQEHHRATAAENHPLTSFRSAKEGEELDRKADGYMETYNDNHRRRRIQIHQDFEERYMKPLHGRMKSRMNGRPYSTFRETRSRAVTELKEKSGVKLTGLCSGPLYNPLDDNEASSLPFVTIPTRGLEDRIHAYQHRAESEAAVTRVIGEVNGTLEEPPPLKERMTIDPVAWRFLPETRVFYEPHMGPKVRKGRRPYTGILHSRIEQTLDQFGQ